MHGRPKGRLTHRSFARRLYPRPSLPGPAPHDLRCGRDRRWPAARAGRGVPSTPCPCSWMSGPSASAMSSQSCDTRSRRVSATNPCAYMLDLSALAARAMTPRGVRQTRNPLGEMPSAQASQGCQIPVDKPASRLYTHITSPIFGGSSHPGLRLVDRGSLPMDHTWIYPPCWPPAMLGCSPQARFLLRPQLLTRV